MISVQVPVISMQNPNISANKKGWISVWPLVPSSSSSKHLPTTLTCAGSKPGMSDPDGEMSPISRVLRQQQPSSTLSNILK